jgi:molecular chaperone HscA
VNEPTAAALAYGIGLNPDEEKTVAVYDLGGGTFDISILRLHQGIFEVLSTHGDTWLGGDDMDRAVVEFWQEKFALSPAFQAVPALQQQLRLAAEMAKRYLSQHDDFTTQLIDGDENVTVVTLTRAEFDGLIRPLVERTIAACRQALGDAQLAATAINAVLLVGGSTRVPLVYDEVSKFFGQPANNSLNPDEVVALGAAIQADILAGNRRDVLLLDVTPLTLGIETLGGLMDAIIPRNSKIPTKAGRQYTTSVDGQVNLKIGVYQGERDLVGENRKLGEFVLTGIPAMPAGLPKIDVNFFLNADGILRVEAVELRSNTRQQVDIKPQYGLTDDQVEQMLMDSLTNAKQDVAARLLIEARTAAEQLLYQVERFLKKNAEHLEAAEVSTTTAKTDELRQALTGNNRDLILKRMDELDELTRPFAERVMNISIKQAMSGKKIG